MWAIAENKACYTGNLAGGSLVQNGILNNGAFYVFRFRITGITKGRLLVPSFAPETPQEDFNENNTFVLAGTATGGNLAFVAGQDERGVFDGCISIVGMWQILQGPFEEFKSEPVCFDDCLKDLEYWNDHDNLLDDIHTVYSMGYKNKIFLRSILRNEEFEEDQNVYVDSKGNRNKTFSRLSKTIEIATDDIPAYVREKLAIATTHDHVVIDGKEYVADNNWSNSPREKIAKSKATLRLYEKKYNITNDNC